LDGATSRKCNAVTPEGASLDFFFDIIFAPSALIAIGYRRFWSPLTTLAAISSYAILSLHHMPTKQFLDDNSIIVKPLMYGLLANFG
jgi:phosphatidylglycerophosphate synthase